MPGTGGSQEAGTRSPSGVGERHEGAASGHSAHGLTEAGGVGSAPETE
jgi:hypothetical protein